MILLFVLLTSRDVTVPVTMTAAPGRRSPGVTVTVTVRSPARHGRSQGQGHRPGITDTSRGLPVGPGRAAAAAATVAVTVTVSESCHGLRLGVRVPGGSASEPHEY